MKQKNKTCPPDKSRKAPSLAHQVALMAILADMGLLSKKVIAPVANLVTDSLHIPGGISTGFSLMFLVLAAGLVKVRLPATKMSLLQSVVALSMGMVGSMGLLTPIGYLVPGLTIDFIRFLLLEKRQMKEEYYVLAGLFASLSAAMTANCIVFRMWGWLLILYGAVASASGLVCGIFCWHVYYRLPDFIKEGEPS